MEHTFGAGTLVRDAASPHRYLRTRSRGQKARTRLAAVGLAVAGVFVLGGVAYGGATSGPQHVVVHRGDTLWGIASAHYPGDDLQYRVNEIEATNHLAGGVIIPGQALTLPAS